MRLTAASNRPPWMDDLTAATYMETLPQALWDYPIDIVERACRDWRKTQNGKWWPAEQDLRAICEKMVEPRRVLHVRAVTLLAEIEQREEYERAVAERASNPSYFPGEAAAEFKRRCRKAMTPRAFDAWFHPTQTKYEGDVIQVRSPIAQTVLNRDYGADLRELGLSAVFDPNAWNPKKEPDRELDPAPPTDAERVENLALLRRVAVSMGGTK